MPTSIFALKLLILMIPGGIATLILEKLTTYMKWDVSKFVINSILMGGLSYLVADLILYPFRSNEITHFWNTFTGEEIPFWDVLFATLASLIVGFTASFIENKKIITNLARKWNVADKYGEENLYSYFLNRQDINEIYLKDIANNLTFHGVIDSFSETDSISEISLRDVKVYRYEDSELLYEMPKVFLSRPKDSIFIEVPDTN